MGGTEVDTIDAPLPALLGLDAPFPFVARGDAWATLTEAWELAAGGGRRVLLVGGDAGSGKTRLVTELARWVHGQGGVVMYGACTEQPTVPYEPFTLALDELLSSLDRASRTELLRDRGHELARLLPRLASAVAPEGRPATPVDLAADPPRRTPPDRSAGPRADQRAEPRRSTDPTAERFRLFDAVTSLLAAVAASRPLLVVLDDLHWARRPTIELLEHVVRSTGQMRLAVVGTYRSTPAEVREAFKRALPDLRRQAGVARLVLGGFDRDGIRRFVRAVAGHDLVPGLEPAVDVLANETGGNAFLLGELWRELVDAGHVVQVGGRWQVTRRAGEVASPEGVREVVAARLARLSPDTRDLVHLAAVVGTTFRIDVVAAASGLDAGQVLTRLDPAVRARIVEETGTGAHRFLHALVRRAVVDALPAGERRSHHRAVAAAIERLDGEGAVADIAHHTLAAVPVVEPERAADVGRRAAHAARRAVAYDDAARFLEAVLPLVPPGRSRGELLLELADARMRAGDVADAQSRCLEATELARSFDQPDLVVAAALAYDDANWRAALHGGVAAELLQAALPLAAEPASAIRVQAALGRALALSGQGQEAETLAEATIAAARQLGDGDTLRIAYAAALFVPWTPDSLDRLQRHTRALLDVARSENDPEWELGGLDKLLFGTIFAGDLDEARNIAARHRALAARVGQPLFRVLDLQAHALLAMGEGRFADAAAAAEEADGLAGLLSGNDAAGGYGVQMFSIRREQGRLDEARPLVEAVARFDQAGATWRPALAVLYAELGLHAEAARELDRLVADGLAAVPRDSLWWGSLSYLADACVLLGDRDAAAMVYRELAPARGLVVQVGNLLAAYGSVDRYLGALSGLMGRHRDAEAHFETALRIDTRARMPVWVARTHVAYGRFLAHRAGTGGGASEDRARAEVLLRAGHDAAHRCGMAGVAAEAAELLELVSSDRSAPTATVGREPVDSRTPAPVPATAMRARPGVGLTGRELDILPLLAEGCTNREIGERLHISQHTAANHIRSILTKTGCSNRTEAATWALRRGLAGAGMLVDDQAGRDVD